MLRGVIERATCPACRRALPRSGYFHGGTRPAPCPYCATPIRKNPQWEWTGNIIFGTLMGLSSSVGILVGILMGSVLLAAIGLVVPMVFFGVLGWVLYPWGTRFDLAVPTPRCAVCGYDLRASPARCPECGTWPPPGAAPRPYNP